MGGTAGMPVRRRRRADAVLLAIAVLVVGVAATVGALAGDTERIAGLWTSAEISANGSARITEVIDYDFGLHHRHGIFRDVPGLAPDAVVSVSSATAPDQFELIGMGAATRIRIGDPSRTIRGRHRHRIQYPLGGFAPGGQLAWDAVGTAWPVALGRIEIHVVAPFALTAVRCAQGVAGSRQACDVAQPAPGRLDARIGRLGAGEGATLYASAGRELGDAPRLPAPPAGALADAGINPLVPGLLAAAVALLAAALVSWLMRRRGRQRVAPGGAVEATWDTAGAEVRVDSGNLESSVLPGFGPPTELTPAQGGILLAEAVRNQHKVAWLLSAAIDGHLEIKGKGPQVTLVRRPHADALWLDPRWATAKVERVKERGNGERGSGRERQAERGGDFNDPPPF